MYSETNIKESVTYDMISVTDKTIKLQLYFSSFNVSAGSVSAINTINLYRCKIRYNCISLRVPYSEAKALAYKISMSSHRVYLLSYLNVMYFNSKLKYRTCEFTFIDWNCNRNNSI